jgi:hypothetical protein
MKNEIKFEWKDSQFLKEYIDRNYKGNSDMMYITNREPLVVEEENVYLKGCHNFIVKVFSPSVVEGFLRCIVVEKEDCIYLEPINIYCMIEPNNDKYIFL